MVPVELRLEEPIDRLDEQARIPNSRFRLSVVRKRPRWSLDTAGGHGQLAGTGQNW
jgi:hypothetical protein